MSRGGKVKNVSLSWDDLDYLHSLLMGAKNSNPDEKTWQRIRRLETLLEATLWPKSKGRIREHN